MFFLDVCDGCDMRNGVGFAPHPGDCYRFVQCYFGANGEIRSAIRKCPYGQYWDQRSLTCQLSVKVTCKNGICTLELSIFTVYGNANFYKIIILYCLR